MRGVGNLTRAAYATAYDALRKTSPRLQSKLNTKVALRRYYVACLLIVFTQGVWRRLP